MEGQRPDSGPVSDDAPRRADSAVKAEAGDESGAADADDATAEDAVAAEPVVPKPQTAKLVRGQLENPRRGGGCRVRGGRRLSPVPRSSHYPDGPGPPSP